SLDLFEYPFALLSISTRRSSDLPELLGVDVEQLAGCGVLVALHGFGRLQRRQLREAGAAQHAADGSLRHAQAGSNSRLGQPPARPEEHTSELQSREILVFRLLIE